MTRTLPKELRILLFMVAAACGLTWCARAAGVSPMSFIKGLANAPSFGARFFPPDLTILPRMFPKVLETVYMAVLGTVAALGLAIPLALLGARTPHRTEQSTRLPGHSWTAYGASLNWCGRCSSS